MVVVSLGVKMFGMFDRYIQQLIDFFFLQIFSIVQVSV